MKPNQTKSYIWYIDMALNKLHDWYAIKANQTKSYIFDIYV